MPSRIDVAPGILAWARLRSGRTVQEFAKKFPKLIEWEAGVLSPTMKQLEDYANATYTPIGFFFLPQPPVEKVPIPDFRTFRDDALHTPTPDLLDTIYACEQRQDWYRQFAEGRGYEPVEIVGSQNLGVKPRRSGWRYAGRARLFLDSAERL